MTRRGSESQLKWGSLIDLISVVCVCVPKPDSHTTEVCGRECVTEIELISLPLVVWAEPPDMI